MPVTVDTAKSRVLPTTDINLVSSATSLIPTLRSRSSETDALARLPGSTIADLEKAQLFDMLVPTMYGGLQCSLRTFMDVVVELGRGDGSAAWTVALLSASTWMAATLYPKHVVDEIFSGGNFGVNRAAGGRMSRRHKFFFAFKFHRDLRQRGIIFITDVSDEHLKFLIFDWRTSVNQKSKIFLVTARHQQSNFFDRGNLWIDFADNSPFVNNQQAVR